jgi:hypothetical protein
VDFQPFEVHLVQPKGYELTQPDPAAVEELENRRVSKAQGVRTALVVPRLVHHALGIFHC